MTLLGADPRAYLSVEHDTRYALGDPDAPLLVLNDADDYGCLWVADVPEGWEVPEITLPMDRKPSGHGGFAGEPTFDPRTLTVAGLVTAPSSAALTAAGQRWRTACLGSIPMQVRYTHLDEDPPRGLWVYPSGKPLWRALDDQVAEFSVVLVAEDPIKTSAPETYGPVRLPSAAGEGGYVAPITAPATAVSDNSAPRATAIAVPNAGDEDSHAVYVVNGPVPHPTIDLDTGEFVQLNADLGALDTWQVDTAAGTFTINGVNRFDALGAGSTFPLIPPGGTTMRLRSLTGGNDPAAGLSATTTSSWM